MLEVEQVAVSRGGQVLRYDFKVEPGTILTIQGRSGIGKSTLLDLLAGFIWPDSGDIRWCGESWLPLAVGQRAVSMLFQSHNLFEHLSVLKNLHLGLVFDHSEQRDAAILQAAQQLEVVELLARKPASLSGGQRQRVALLRTLLRPEPLVLLDEPFTGLDDQSRALASDWVKSTAHAQQKTVLLVTHQDDDVRQLADRNLRLGE